MCLHNNLTKIYLLLSFIGTVTSSAISQDIKTYSGAYNGQHTQGKATYSYYENTDFERIYHGSFSYTGTYNSITTKINGSYKDNKKNGEWNYSQMLTSSKNSTSASLKFNGHYVNGNFDGRWEFFLSRPTTGFKTSETNPAKKKQTQSYVINFNSGRFAGSYKFEHIWEGNVNEVVSGMFNQKGYLEGQWIHKWKEEDTNIPHEGVYNFKDGVISKYLIRNMATGEIIERGDKTDFVEEFFTNYDKGMGYSIIADTLYACLEKKEEDYSFSRVIKFWHRSSSGSNFENSNCLYEIPLGSNSPESPISNKLYSLRITKADIGNIVSEEELNKIIKITKANEDIQRQEYNQLIKQGKAFNRLMTERYYDKKSLNKAYFTIGKSIFGGSVSYSHISKYFSIEDLLKLYEYNRIAKRIDEIYNMGTLVIDKKLENETSPIKIKEIIYSKWSEAEKKEKSRIAKAHHELMNEYDIAINKTDKENCELSSELETLLKKRKNRKLVKEISQTVQEGFKEFYNKQLADYIWDLDNQAAYIRTIGCSYRGNSAYFKSEEEMTTLITGLNKNLKYWINKLKINEELK